MARVFFVCLAEIKPNISKYIKKIKKTLNKFLKRGKETGMSVLRIPDADMRAFWGCVCVCVSVLVGDEASGWKVLQYGPRSIFTKAFYRWEH